MPNIGMRGLFEPKTPRTRLPQLIAQLNLPQFGLALAPRFDLDICFWNSMHRYRQKMRRIVDPYRQSGSRMGWCHRIRDHVGVIIDLRDHTG